MFLFSLCPSASFAYGTTRSGRSDCDCAVEAPLLYAPVFLDGTATLSPGKNAWITPPSLIDAWYFNPADGVPLTTMLT